MPRGFRKAKGSRKTKGSRNLAKHCPTCHRQEILYVIGLGSQPMYRPSRAHFLVVLLIPKMFPSSHTCIIPSFSPKYPPTQQDFTNFCHANEPIPCSFLPQAEGDLATSVQTKNLGGRSYAVLPINLTWCIGIGGCRGYSTPIEKASKMNIMSNMIIYQTLARSRVELPDVGG